MRHRTSTFSLLLGGVLSVAAQASAQDAAIPVDGLELWVKADGPMKGAGNQITEWTDASNSGNNAVHDAFGQDIPVLASANGKPTLHFSGAYTGFHFNKLNDVRTLFVVLSKDSTSCLPTLPNYGTPAKFWVGGNDNPTYFHPEHGCSIYNANLSEVSPNLVNGKTYLNGKLVDGRVTRFPFVLGLVSIVSTANVAADTIARDRNFNDRSWQGDISELLIYNRALDDATRIGIQNSLSLKYAIQIEGGPVIGMGGSAGTSGGQGGSAGAGGSAASGGTGGATESAGSSNAGTGGSAGTAPTATAGSDPSGSSGSNASGGGSGGSSAGGNGPEVTAGGSDVNASSPTADSCACRAAGQNPGHTPGKELSTSLAVLAAALWRRRRSAPISRCSRCASC